MGIIVNKEDDKNSDLTRRINADLREKTQKTTYVGGNADPDLAEDSDYVKDLQKTSRFGWIWLVLIVLAAASLVFIVFF